MDQPVDDLGEASCGTAGLQDMEARASRGAIGDEADSCVGGERSPTMDVDHRGVLSDVRVPEVFDALHEIEEFVRRNPWPILALGFAAGYFLSRRKVR